MALVIPDELHGRVSEARRRVFVALRRHPDRRLRAWHRLWVHLRPGPDFLLLAPDNRALLIRVSELTRRDLEAHRQPELFASAASELPTAARRLQQEAEVFGALARDTGLDSAPALARVVPCALLFPHLDALNLLPGVLVFTGLSLHPRGVLLADAFPAWVERRLGPPLATDALARLRGAFTPEVEVPAELTTRGPIQRSTGAALTRFFLDYDQERVLKQELTLPGPADQASADLRLRLVNGVAGSGKSLIVIYRVGLLRRLYPEARILVLTHNRALLQDLRGRYELLAARDRLQTSGIQWRTFHGWCLAHAPARPGWRKQPLGDHDQARKEMIQRAWRQHLRGTRITPAVLVQELAWFKDRFQRPEQYLLADRRGRGFGLGRGREGLRGRVLAAMEAYQRQLLQRRVLDWGDLPWCVYRAMRDGSCHAEPYDFVLVDEAQFFAPLWFQLVKRLVKPGQGQLFMVADPTQGFLRRRLSWLAAGLEVRGRSVHLRRSFRTTSQLLRFATRFYFSRLGQDDEVVVRPEFHPQMPPGPPPALVRLRQPQDEVARVANEVHRLHSQGAPLRDMLLIHHDYRGVRNLISAVGRRVGRPDAVVDPRKVPWRDQARALTLDAVTGLEAPLVLVAGLGQLFEPEGNPELSARQRAELVRDNTRKAYMAFTRAGQRLALFYSGQVPPELLEALEELGDDGEPLSDS